MKELTLEIKAEDGLLTGTLAIDSKRYQKELQDLKCNVLGIFSWAKLIVAAGDLLKEYSVNTKK